MEKKELFNLTIEELEKELELANTERERLLAIYKANDEAIKLEYAHFLDNIINVGEGVETEYVCDIENKIDYSTDERRWNCSRDRIQGYFKKNQSKWGADFTLYIYADKIGFNIGSYGESYIDSEWYQALRGLVIVMEHEQEICEFARNIDRHNIVALDEINSYLDTIKWTLNGKVTEKKRNEAKALIKEGKTFAFYFSNDKNHECPPSKVFKIDKVCPKTLKVERYYIDYNSTYDYDSGTYTYSNITYSLRGYQENEKLEDLICALVNGWACEFTPNQD